MTNNECLIALNMISGLGCVKIMKLLEHFKFPQLIIAADKKELFAVAGISKSMAESIHEIALSGEFKEELLRVQALSIKVITILDAEYPKQLKQIYDPPIVLYVKGQLPELSPIAVSIVGCRRASSYGLEQAQRLGNQLGQKGISVISGMARGIDTAAHQGVLSAGGKTVAVLGSGLMNIYPAESKNLYIQISQQGAIISEYSLQTMPLRENFPQRNRIISGLSNAVIVVEAAKRSGSLITARLALEQGRDVYAVPGQANAFNAQGTNYLIKEGAKLVENVEDFLDDHYIFSQ